MSKFTSYDEVLTFLYNHLPMFQRIGGQAYNKDLSKTIHMLNLMGNPQRRFKTIHVAGTNGKGSTSHMLASVYQEAGYKTGLYTSPHLVRFTERIKINGIEMSEQRVLKFMNDYHQIIDELQPSFFEATVGMAFDYFADENVDIAIIEVGMGGRLDSTNVVRPLASIITNIGFDHQQFLGNTLPLIAEEKAGIIKEGIPVVVGTFQKQTFPVFEKKALEMNAPLYRSDTITLTGEIQYFHVEHDGFKLKQIETDLLGIYTKWNIPGVLKVLEVVQPFLPISTDAIKRGLKNTIKNTELRGRWEVYESTPLTICDTGHNEDGIRAILMQINSLSYDQLHLVWGSVNDKDINKVLKLLPKDGIYYFCRPDIPRGLDAKELQSAAKVLGLEGKVYESVKSAVAAAQKKAGTSDLVFVGGSTFVVADLLK